MEVPDFVIENIENTLRLCANTFNSYEKKTCLDRDIIACVNYTPINGGASWSESTI